LPPYQSFLGRSLSQQCLLIAAASKHKGLTRH